MAAAGTMHSPMCYSPRKTGVLASTYDERFGSKNFLATDYSSVEAIVTPRHSRRPIVDDSSVTDPRNPFNRTPSKLVKQHNEMIIDDVRADNNRAGRRTYNPSMIKSAGAVGYSTTVDFRPGKVFRGEMRGSGNPIALSEVQAEPLPGQDTNYLNDMKTDGNSRRSTEHPPSVSLRRMKEREVRLPHEMAGVGPRPQQVNSSPQRVESKRIIQDFAGTSTSDMLYHPGGNQPAVKRFQRLEGASDRHFSSIVDHMKKTTTEQRTYGQLFRARDHSSIGLFADAE